MLAKFARPALAVFLAAATSAAFAQTSTTPAPTNSVPTSAAANAAVDVNAAIGGRIIACPQGLRISPQAVCLFANGNVDALKPRVKARLGERVIEDWRTRTGSRNASLLFRNGNDITYVLLAQANPTTVLAIIDAPATAAQAAPAGQGTAAAGTTGQAAPTAAASGVAYAAARDLAAVVSVQAADTVGTFTRLGQSVVVTANNRNARFGTGQLQLAGAPYTAGGQLYVPVTLLRSLGCTVADAQGGKVNVTCGARTAAVNVVSR